MSYNTIYRYIYRYNLFVPKSTGVRSYARQLRHRGKQRHHGEPDKRGTPAFTTYITIDERPHFINVRTRIGDLEINTVLGKTGHSALVTAVDRQTKYTWLAKIIKKNQTQVRQALTNILDSIPVGLVHSLTPDHGKEFYELRHCRAVTV